MEHYWLQRTYHQCQSHDNCNYCSRKKVAPKEPNSIWLLDVENTWGTTTLPPEKCVWDVEIDRGLSRWTLDQSLHSFPTTYISTTNNWHMYDPQQTQHLDHTWNTSKLTYSWCPPHYRIFLAYIYIYLMVGTILTPSRPVLYRWSEAKGRPLELKQNSCLLWPF